MRKRKSVKVFYIKGVKESDEKMRQDINDVISKACFSEKFIIGDDVRDMFRNRGEDARKKD